MKKLLFAIGLLICSNIASAQYWQVIKGHYEYQFFRVDSLIRIPSYHTVGRPTPGSQGAGAIIFNIDSSKMQISDGSNWSTLNGVSGGGGGGSMVNVGSGYRLIVIGTSNQKTLGQNFGLIIDSLTSNEIHFTIDSTKVGTLFQVNLRVKYSDTATMLTPYLRKIDTTAMLTVYLRKADTAAMLSVYLRSNLGVKYTDTSAMLAPYLRKTDTTAMLTPYLRSILGVKYTDTAAMLSHYDRNNVAVKYADSAAMLTPYLRKADTAAMLAVYLRSNLGVKYTDTAAMLLPYLRKADTAAMLAPYSRSNAVVKYTDTASMLTPYLRKFDTTAMLVPYLRANVAAATYYLQSNPSLYIARTGISNAAPITYNSGTGVIGADTSKSIGKLATFSDVQNFIPALPTGQIPVGASNLYASSVNLTFTSGKLHLNQTSSLNYDNGNGIMYFLGTGTAPSGTPQNLTAFGLGATNTSMSGVNNTAYGFQSLTSDLGGHDLSAFGLGSLKSNTTGNFNIGLGKDALKNMQTGSNNIGIGTDSSASTSSINNYYYFGNGFTTYRANSAYFGRNDQLIVLGNGGGNTTKMNSLNTPAAGDIYFNTDSSAYVMYNGAAWLRWGGTGGGGGNIISINSLTNPAITLQTGTLGADFNISTTAPGTINFNLPTADGSHRGALVSADWTTFNGKQNALSFGNLTEVTSNVLVATGNIGAVIGSGVTIQVKQATNTQSGYLSSTDWNTFNSKGNGIVTSITSGSPAIGIGGTSANPVITFNLSGLPNSYYLNGVHARNDSTVAGGGGLDSMLYYHGVQQVRYDSITNLEIDKYGTSQNTVNDGIYLRNATAATTSNSQYGPATYSEGRLFNGSSQSFAFRHYTKPSIGAITGAYVFETSWNGNSYQNSGQIESGPSGTIGGTAHFGAGNFGIMTLGYTELTALANLVTYFTNCTSGTFTVTLPLSASGSVYHVLNSGSGTITVGTTSSQNITFGASTATSFTLTQGKWFELAGNGTKWYVIGNN